MSGAKGKGLWACDTVWDMLWVIGDKGGVECWLMRSE